MNGSSMREYKLLDRESYIIKKTYKISLLNSLHHAES